MSAVRLNLAWLPLLAVGLSGCSSLVDWISPPEIDPPAELLEIEQRVSVDKLWSRDVGDDKSQRLHLKPLVVGDSLYVADASGEVRKLSVQSGKPQWSIDTDLALAGGPGVGEGLVVVGTSDAEVLALNVDNGAEVWRSRVSSEVLSTPVPVQGRVIVRTIDGKVLGLDARDGKELWRFERDIPVLTLRGTGSPVVYENSVLCGLAGGRLIALDIATGDVLWETVVSVPTGRSELERLTDIDGDPLVLYGIVYVATYQGDVAAIGARSGDLLWRRKFSAYSGMGADQNKVYAADSEGVVWALDADNGSARWRQEELLHRRLSQVGVINDLVVVGDFEGYVHFLSADNGEQMGRVRVGSDPIINGVLVADGLLLVKNEDGELQAMRVSPTP